MVTFLMMSAKLATLAFLKIKLFWNRSYDVIISVHDVTNKILSCYSNYIGDVVMWPKFGNYSISISIREVIITFKDFYSWFKFSNLRLALGMVLKFYISVPKRLKLKVIKFLFLGLILTFVEVTGEKLVEGGLNSRLISRFCLSISFFSQFFFNSRIYGRLVRFLISSRYEMKSNIN